MSISDKEIGRLLKLDPICEQSFDDRGLINEPVNCHNLVVSF